MVGHLERNAKPTLWRRAVMWSVGGREALVRRELRNLVAPPAHPRAAAREKVHPSKRYEQGMVRISGNSRPSPHTRLDILSAEILPWQHLMRHAHLFDQILWFGVVNLP